jgi:hypothetical protein
MKNNEIFGIKIYSFEEIIDKNVTSDKLKILLKGIDHYLDTIEKVLAKSSSAKSLRYVSDIKIKFHIHGIAMFKKDPEVIDLLMGCFLYSQTIDVKKIRCPRALTNEQKDQFKKDMTHLIEAWILIGKHFSFDKLLEISVTDVENREKLRAKLQADLGF